MAQVVDQLLGWVKCQGVQPHLWQVVGNPHRAKAHVVVGIKDCAQAQANAGRLLGHLWGTGVRQGGSGIDGGRGLQCGRAAAGVQPDQRRR